MNASREGGAVSGIGWRRAFRRILALFLILTLLGGMPSLLPRARAVSPDEYTIEVDVANQITTVYRADDHSVVRQMICSTGRNGCTPLGDFKLAESRTSTDRREWYYLSNYHCYVRYATRIRGPILFHSLPYVAADLESIDEEALADMGQPVSHGCVRLHWQDAQWIAEHCPDGTRTRIFNEAEKDEPLRALLMQEGYSEACGLTYAQFTSGDYAAKDASMLGRGATGSQVGRLQARLAGLGFFTGAFTGVYDSATIAAVLRYQEAVGHAATGLTDTYLMDQIMTDEETCGHYATLSEGASGPAVRALQETLQALGLYAGEADGVYSADVAEAVRNYCLYTGKAPTDAASPALQEDMNSLVSTLTQRFGAGKFGMILVDTPAQAAYATRDAALYRTPTGGSRIRGVAKGTPVTPLKDEGLFSAVEVDGEAGFMYTDALGYAPIQTETARWGRLAQRLGETDLSRDCVGSAVSELQERLQMLGFYSGEIGAEYDEATADAVMAYQDAAGAPATGICTVAQQEALLTNDAITGTAITLRPGAQSPAVAAMQGWLTALQYLNAPVTGVYDEATAQAVALFVAVNHLEADGGEASPAVQSAIQAQYQDCERRFGAGGYTLNLVSEAIPMARSVSTIGIYLNKDSSGPRLCLFSKGTSARVLAVEDRWARVRYGEVEGYSVAKSLEYYEEVEQHVEFVAKQAG